MNVKILGQKLKSPLEFKRPFSVDPAGFAPASSGANADMLTIYTTGPDPQYYYKTKRILLKEPFL